MSAAPTITDADLKQIQDVMGDPKKVQDILEKFSECPEGFSDAMSTVNDDPYMKRKAMGIARKTNISHQVNSLPLAEKKRLKKSAKKMKAAQESKAAAKLLPVAVVMVTPSRKFKASTLNADYLTAPAYKGWVTEVLPSGLSMFYNPSDPCKNRLTSRILGKNVGNQAYICKIEETGLVPLTVAQVEAIYKV